jgi:CDP-diglyceride synthetase
MSEQQPRHMEEKPEKQEEKDEKDREKQEKEGKSLDEKMRQDPLGAVIWAAILIWAGLVLVAQNMGLLRGLEGGARAWAIILIGAGVIVLLEAVVRLSVPAYRRPIGGTLILGFILLAVGLENWLAWSMAWPVILIIIGVGLLLRALLPRRPKE